MNKNARKLIPAVAMLLVSATMLSTASFAWLSMNSKVTATGMQVNVAAPASIMVRSAWGEDTPWSTNVDFTSATRATLGHASSVDGTSFFAFAPSNESIDDSTGVVPDGTVAEAVTNANFATTYGVSNTVAYADFTFYIATSGTANADVKLDSSATSISLGDATTDALLPAMRFAILTSEAATENTAKDAGVDDFPVVAAPSVNNVWAGAANANNSTKAYDTTSTTKQFEQINTTAPETLVTLKAKTDASTTGYGTPVKVVIRVWLEGQDAACINSNVLSLKTFTVKIGFSK